MDEAILEAKTLLQNASRVVAFTGAGISAESGIPTFRGEGGLWTEYNPNLYADVNYFLSNPSYYWSFFRDVRYPVLARSEPNPAHHALVELEKQGKLEAVITQNIDGLHIKAGSKRVIELHGNAQVIACLQCHSEYPYEHVYQQVLVEIPPTCSECGGLLKPKVVFFGETLPAEALEQANAAAANCDLLMVIGSTLLVFPAASLPVVARRNGAKIIIINLGQTDMDEIADVRIDAKAGEVLPKIIAT
jgi:NAD-dependent deacetylase